MADMYEQPSDSDDDCEVYFLKPVNEYNIVDKIREANKELFANIPNDQNVNSNAIESESTMRISTTTTTTTTTTKITTMRKVTFAPNLEDYEPENLTKVINDSFSDEESTADKTENFNCSTKTELKKFPTIDEEEAVVVSNEYLEKEGIAQHEEQKLQLNLEELKETNKSLQPLAAEAEAEANDDLDDVDEICEEILVMEMESSTTTKTTTTLPKTDLFSSKNRRAIHKQTTFDCDCDYECDEQDNKSLMNLLTASDAEEDDSCAKQVSDYDDEDDANDASIFNGIDDFDEELYDDDDKLSLIVASYLPDDYERAAAISPTTNPAMNSAQKSHSYFRRSAGKPSSSFSFSRRFQLRRKAHSTNSIGTVTSGIGSAGGTSKNDNAIGLKLNYKTCCEYRNSIHGKLPKYTGYLSEYGLSQEQLQQREQKLQKRQRFVLEQAIKTSENDMQKMQDNERAFTSWLRNKMRFPINKTRNMFDVKLRFTGKKKNTLASENGNGSGKHIGPLDCVAKLRTNS